MSDDVARWCPTCGQRCWSNILHACNEPDRPDGPWSAPAPCPYWEDGIHCHMAPAEHDSDGSPDRRVSTKTCACGHDVKKRDTNHLNK